MTIQIERDLQLACRYLSTACLILDRAGHSDIIVAMLEDVAIDAEKMRETAQALVDAVQDALA
jgi:hypothetical protein